LSCFFFFSSRRRHTRFSRDWSSDVCSSDLDRAEIRDLLAYLRLLANDDDDPAFIRAVTTPKRGVGPASLQALGAYAGERGVSMFEALFETGFESRIAARQLEPLREFGAFVNRMGWRAAREPAAQVLEDLLRAIDYEAHLHATSDEKVAAGRWRNVCDFVDWMKKRAEDDDATLLQLAQTIALLSQLDRRDSDVDAVRLTTIHAAKGLEFPHVFVVGCEEGLLPHRGDATTAVDGDEAPEAGGAADARGRDLSHDDPDARRIEEERRLMYVAVTRAQRSLTLTWCRQRRRGRELLARLPSRFLAEMQLEASPSVSRTVSQAQGRARLAGLKALLERPAATRPPG